LHDDASRTGHDVDARFLLANERTLLAWVRTGLTLQAAGVGVFQLGNRLDARELIALLLLGLGAACHGAGWWRYQIADRALRERRLPRRGYAPEALVLATILLSVGVAVVLFRS
jgi:putative membrane protein